MPEYTGTLHFDDAGDLHQTGAVPVSRYLDEVGTQLNRFLTRLASCQRTKSGNYLLRDPAAGRLRGVQILWENTERIAQASISLLVVTPKWDEMMLEAQRNDGVTIKAGLLPPRTSQAVVDLLSQILFALPRNGAGEWPKEIPVTAVDKLRLLANELPDYRDQFLLHEKGAVQMMTSPSESTPFELLATTARMVSGFGDRATDRKLWDDAMTLYRADPTLPVLPVRTPDVLVNLTNIEAWAVLAGKDCTPPRTMPPAQREDANQDNDDASDPSSTTERKTKPEQREISLILRGRGKGPVVCGVEKDVLSDAKYDVIDTLISAGERGLTKDLLVKESGRGDAVNTLSKLVKNDPEWAAVCPMPGKPGRGYRVLNATRDFKA